MAMKKRFYTMNSQMMAYDEGGVTKDFLTDHLGSITAEINQSQTRTYDTRYSAYGRNNWSTGTGCGFGWVGSYGYRETGLFHMSHYVRARHYSYLTGGWSTVDPLWPDESAYGYVGGGSTLRTDRSGQNWDGCPKPNPYKDGFDKLKGAIGKICDKPKPDDPKSPVYECWKKCGESTPGEEAKCFCNHASGKSSIDFSCDDSRQKCLYPSPVGNGGTCMGTEQGGLVSNCEIRICPKICIAKGIDITQAIFHEIMHCCGAKHRDKPKPGMVRIGCLETCLRGKMGWPPIVWPAPIPKDEFDVLPPCA